MNTKYLVGNVEVTGRNAAQAEYSDQYRKGLRPIVARVVVTDVTQEFLNNQKHRDEQFVANWPGGKVEAVAILEGKRPYKGASA